MTKPHRKTKPVPPKVKKAHKQAATRSKLKPPAKIIERLEWQGIVLSISYQAHWLGMGKGMSSNAITQLEIAAISPKRTVLPITDTSYRSQFLPSGKVESAGGPATYAKAWLDHVAKAPAWKRREEDTRQLCLF